MENMSIMNLLIWLEKNCVLRGTKRTGALFLLCQRFKIVWGKRFGNEGYGK